MADENEVKIVISAQDNASKILAAVSQIFNMVSSAVRDTVNSYVDYGKQVEVMADYLDISTDATSRLIQVGADAEVSYDTIKLAAKKLATDGIAPNTDAMAKLSDQYLAIQDPLQRTQFLIDTFGRSGMEMSKIMELGGTKIKALSADVSESLIIDQKKKDAIDKTKDAEIAFNQQVEGIKYEAAGVLLDIFNSLPAPLKTTIQLMGSAGSAGLLNQLTQLSILVTEISKAGGIGAVLTSIGTGAKAMAAGFSAVAAPIAITVGWLDFMIHLVQDNWGTISKLFAIIGYYTLGIDPSWAIGNADSGGLSISGLQAKIDAMPHHARGGAASGWSVVGENGPELRYSPPGSQIYSNADSQRMMGGTTVNVYYQPGIGIASEDDVRRMAPLIKRSLRYAA